VDRYQQTVDRITEVLYAARKVERKQIEPLAAAYGKDCVEVNKQLRDIGDLLAQGLRTEALYKSDLSKVLPSITTLDFPELSQWLKLTTSLGIPRTPALFIDIAGDLNEAYDAQLPLIDLLAKHRLLAIGRAPLVSRIAVLRLIAQRDKRNPIWRRDLNEYEKSRFEKLRKEFDQHVKNKDVRAAVALQTELKQTQVAKPPLELVKHIDANVARLLGGLSRKQLGQLADQLNEAMSDLDIERAAELLKQWRQVVGFAKPQANDPAVQTANRVVAWIESEKNAQIEQEEEAYQKSLLETQLADFKAAVKGKSSQEALVKLREELNQLGVVVPKFLEGQYEARLKEIRLRRIINISIIVGIAIVSLVGVGVAIFLLA